MIKRIKKILYEFDFLWSIPVAFVMFIVFPLVGANIWGDDFAFYPPEFFHGAIYAGLITILFNSMTQMGIYFNFPELYNYYLGENFKELKPWERIFTFLFVYSFFFLSLLGVWKTLA